MAVDTPAQLPLKGLHLLVLVGLVPVEVNTHLANGDPLMTDELLLQLVKSLAPVVAHLLGMQSQSQADVFGPLRLCVEQALHALEVLVGQDDVCHAGVNGSLHHLRAVVIKLRAIDMAMRVNHFWRVVRRVMRSAKA